MLSPVELAQAERGQLVKRYVRAAAALQGLFDDAAIAHEVGVNRMAVGRWWQGVQPKPPAIERLAIATGLSSDELMRFVYFDGPPPSLPEPGSAVASGVQEGIRRDQERQLDEDLQGLAPSPEPIPRDTGAG